MTQAAVGLAIDDCRLLSPHPPFPPPFLSLLKVLVDIRKVSCKKEGRAKLKAEDAEDKLRGEKGKKPRRKRSAAFFLTLNVIQGSHAHKKQPTWLHTQKLCTLRSHVLALNYPIQYDQVST